MTASMTGSGTATGPFGDGRVTVSLRTVNNRYLKITVKVPEALSAYERSLEGLLRKRVVRGTVICSVRVTDSGHTAIYHVHIDRAEAYRETLEALGRKLGLPADQSIGVDLLASLPGVIEAEPPAIEAFDETTWQPIQSVIESALAELTGTRDTEGAELARDVAARVDTITERAETLTTRAGSVVEEYRKKLEDRIAVLLKDRAVPLAATELAREVAIFADRADISEELTRLKHHCGQIKQTLARKGEQGRRLEFIAQEMLREANTIGAKCSDALMIDQVVDVKVEVEKIKEQVQNIE